MTQARSGGFGSSTTPFGGGSFGSNLGQYLIGQTLADLEVYTTTTAYNNGMASDTDYLAALQKAFDATDPGTHQRIAAQNALDDANYNVGRSKANSAGPDALIAFDQASVAKFDPASDRGRSVQQSLDSELSQRRSRDYGKLVDAYQAGNASTQSLLDWVNTTVKGLATTAPDYSNWTGTQSDLGQRLKSEKDAQVYQDYQDRKVTPDAFLAYISGRRDEYGADSPQFADWQRKLDDATKQVTDTRNAQADEAFFNAYQEGKKTDAAYLAYMKGRIAGMATDDPNLPTWQHRLHDAVFSLTEDALRFKLQEAKGVGAQKQDAAKLLAFYKHARTQVVPGSAEYRSLSRNIDSLAAFRPSGGSVGGGGARRVSGGAAPKVVVKTAPIGPNDPLYNPKSFGTQQRVDFALSLMLSSPTGLENTLLTGLTKGQKAIVKGAKLSGKTAAEYLMLNLTSIEQARGVSDTWTFYDPRHPGKTVQLPMSDDTYAKLLSIKGINYQSLANAALAQHDSYHYALNMKEATAAYDSARGVSASMAINDAKGYYDLTMRGIDEATKNGDWATVANLTGELTKRLATDRGNQYLDDAARAKIDAIGEKLYSNPLIGRKDPNTGQILPGALDPTTATHNADGSIANVGLAPGWHLELGIDKNGAQDWGPKFSTDDPATYAATHLTVHVASGDRAVTGSVEIKSSPVDPVVFIKTIAGGQAAIQLANAQSVTYIDSAGNLVRAYSIDGTTWIKSDSGTAPMLEATVPMVETPNADGSVNLTSPDGTTVYFTKKPGGVYVKDPGVDPGTLLQWYGQGTAQMDTGYAGYRTAGYLTPEQVQTRIEVGYRTHSGDLGGPGQNMTITVMPTNPDGSPVDGASVDLLPRPTVSGRADYRTAGVSAADAPGNAGYRTAGYAPTRAPLTLPEVAGNAAYRTAGYTMPQTPVGVSSAGTAGYRTAGYAMPPLHAQLPPNASVTSYGTGLAPVPPPVLPPLPTISTYVPHTAAPPPLRRPFVPKGQAPVKKSTTTQTAAFSKAHRTPPPPPPKPLPTVGPNKRAV